MSTPDEARRDAAAAGQKVDPFEYAGDEPSEAVRAEALRQLAYAASDAQIIPLDSNGGTENAEVRVANDVVEGEYRLTTFGPDRWVVVAVSAQLTPAACAVFYELYDAALDEPSEGPNGAHAWVTVHEGQTAVRNDGADCAAVGTPTGYATR